MQQSCTSNMGPADNVADIKLYVPLTWVSPLRAVKENWQVVVHGVSLGQVAGGINIPNIN